jgi:hypothetical protein
MFIRPLSRPNEINLAYANQIAKDRRAIEDLARILDSSVEWIHAVRPGRENFVDLLLRCSFFPRPCLVTLGCENWNIFRILLKQSAVFPWGPTEAGQLWAAL